MDGLSARLIEGDHSVPGQGLPGDCMVDTARGPVAIRDLTPGDLVKTLGGDYSPVVSIRRVLPEDADGFGMVSVVPPALGATADIRLCGGQLILLSSWLTAALFSRSEVLACAAKLQDGKTIRRVEGLSGDFHRIVLDRPAVILCGGIPVVTHAPDDGGPARLLRPLLNDYAHQVLADSGIFARRPVLHGAAARARQVAHG